VALARNRYFVLRIGDWRLALPLGAVDRAVLAVELTPLAQAPAVVLGIISVAGDLLPVVDLRPRFRLPQREIVPTDYMLLLRTPKRRVALLTSGLEGIIEVDAGAQVDMATILPGVPHLQGVIKREDGLILVQDVDATLSVDEEMALCRALQQS
jgi:purine-binding chemotaxis protein CheW